MLEMMSAMEKINLGRGNGRAIEVVYAVRMVVTLKLRLRGGDVIHTAVWYWNNWISWAKL